MSGGILAAGARAPVSELDRHLDEALVWDYFLRTYGRTPVELERITPHWMPGCFVIIGSARAEVQEEANQE